ncbi:MAG TPA: VOC family protein [Alphaproteobacteria bacterium]|nr:VOC family protein [Alphaproteobacteria bacterium]
MIDRIDHFVLTVKDVAATCKFYERVLSAQVVTFAGGRKGLSFGSNKINLHQQGQEFEPKAHHPVPGSADFCLITRVPLADVIKRLEKHHVPVIHGPVEKIGALGPMQSVYFRDPDLNLVEVSNYGEARSRTG